MGIHLNAEDYEKSSEKKQAAIRLFKEGKLSSGATAKWLTISRVAFLRMAFEAGAILLVGSREDLRRETALL